MGNKCGVLTKRDKQRDKIEYRGEREHNREIKLDNVVQLAV